MISIVVVSHSRPLARAAVALAAQMVPPTGGPVIEIAAGVGVGGADDTSTDAHDGTSTDDGSSTGTDAVAVAAALTRAAASSGEDGTLVLMDLGSAVLSAEMALELVEETVAARVVLSHAPLVEGLVAAVVAAAAGLDLPAVTQEAEAGLRAKAGHLHEDEARPDHQPTVGDVATLDGSARPETEHPVGHSVELSVLGEHGLHARPAARVVALAAAVSPDTRVQVRNLTSARGPVDALSLSAVATLDAQRGHVLQADAHGPRAQEVLADLVELAGRGFGDLPGPARPAADGGAPEPAVSDEPGVAGSGLGAAVGPVVHAEGALEPTADEAPGRATGAGSASQGDLAAQQQAWRLAVEQAAQRLGELADRARRHLGEGEAEVFAAHRALLQDPQILDAVERGVASGQDATRAWAASIREVAGRFADLTDPYQRARAQDVRSVGERVRRIMLGLQEPEQLGEGILVVTELDPALAIGLDTRYIHGVLTREDGATGHGVLIATARGVPVLTGAGRVLDVPDGTTVAFDARSGRLEVDPSPQVRAEFAAMLALRQAETDRALERATSPVVTTDGQGLVVRANVASVSEARLATARGAHGSGLVRTEAVFASWRTAPTVEQQVQTYRQIAQACSPHPITVRTWDVGGDKPLVFVPSRVESNPFLGTRGLRAFVDDPTILLDQVEAICRVAQEHEVKVLFPMVTTAADVAFVLDLVRRAAARAGLGPGARTLQVGIMIEVPAAAVAVASLAQGVDFISIGSNDLSQYTLAAERGNPALRRWSDHLEPALLALISAVAHQVPAGMPVGLCGTMAADPDLAGLLVGLGVTELSADITSVPMVKERLRSGSLAHYHELAAQALACTDAGQVRALLERHQS